MSESLVPEDSLNINQFREMIRILQDEGMIPSPNVRHKDNPVPDHCPLDSKQMATLQVFGDVMTEERMKTLCSFLDMVTDLRQGSARTLKLFVIGLLLTGMSFFFITGIAIRGKEIVGYILHILSSFAR